PEIRGEAVVREPAIVRSGASDRYFPTGELKPGDRVTVLRMELEYAAIVPPEGSFDWIPAKQVKKNGDLRSGTVNAWTSAETLVGIPTGNISQHRIGPKLPRGAQVEILG